MYKVAVVGAGIMGSDVALDLALNNVSVLLKDVSEEKLKIAREKIASNFRMVKMVKKDIGLNKIDDVLDKIEFTTSYDGFSNLDFVIENVKEVFEVKKEVYAALDAECGAHTLFAANTSCISITAIGALLKSPTRAIGVHFMNPVPLKPMVETIRGFHTSKETETKMVEFLKHIKKNPVVVNDYPGFVANRISHLYMNEAAFVVQDNVASPAQVDSIFKQGYGHAMGPLETADLIGLDTVLDSLHVLYESYKDSKFRPCPLLFKMVNAGLLGRKSGQGFYKY